MNERTENIGARRLYTILERVLEEVSFEAPDLAGKTVTVDAGFVHARLADVIAGRGPEPVHPVTGGHRAAVTSAMEKLIEKAGTLMEALPYIRAFWGKTLVIKYGGARDGVPAAGRGRSPATSSSSSTSA